MPVLDSYPASDEQAALGALIFALHCQEFQGMPCCIRRFNIE
jgi:hypothetical protein